MEDTSLLLPVHYEPLVKRFGLISRNLETYLLYLPTLLVVTSPILPYITCCCYSYTECTCVQLHVTESEVGLGWVGLIAT